MVTWQLMIYSLQLSGIIMNVRTDGLVTDEVAVDSQAAPGY